MRRSTRSEKVVKSISIALAAMVAGTTVMGSMGTITVHAEEMQSAENPSSVSGEEKTVGATEESTPTSEETETASEKAETAVETASKKAEDANETAKSEDKTPKQKEEAVADAAEAVADAADAVDEATTEALEDSVTISSALEILKGKEEDSQPNGNNQGANEDSTSGGSNQGANEDSTSGGSNQGANEDSTSGGSNQGANEDSTTGNGEQEADEVKQEASVSFDGLDVIITDEQGNETKQEFDDYVVAKADEAETAKKKAYNKLNEALKADSKEDAAEIVKDVKKAAEDAQKAADEAQAAYDALYEQAQKAVEMAQKLYEQNGADKWKSCLDMAEKEIEEQQENLNKAKEIAENAQKAADMAQTAVDLVEEIPAQEPLADIAEEQGVEGEEVKEDVLAKAQEKLDEANADLEDAQKKYDLAKKNLKSAEDTLEYLTENEQVDWKVKQRVRQAYKDLAKAERALASAKASALTAQVYSTWANNLITDQEVRCYARKDETKLENGDDGVKSEPVKEYTSISPKGEDGKVIMQTVPYELYNQYVSWLMKDKTEDSQVKNAKLPNGKGIATGEEGTLGIVFWEINEDGTIKVDEDGKATFYYENQDKPAGRYFVAYTLKYESDSFYHFDGVYVDVTKNEETGEDETVLPPAVTEGKDDPSPTFIDDEPVALAASVLGAERARTVENADEQIMVDQNGDVLGADRTPTGDVLGAGRPQTGDYTNTGIALFGAVASGMMLLGYGLKKKKEDEAEEC